MGLLAKLFGKGAKETVESIGGMWSKISEGHLGKKEFNLAVEQMVHARDMANIAEATAEISAKEKILVAEMQSGDNYTRRARPTVVYFGLVAIFLNHILFPWIRAFGGGDLPDIELPTEFWVAWGGVVSVWFVGRSFERRGVKNKLTSAVTGSMLEE